MDSTVGLNDVRADMAARLKKLRTRSDALPEALARIVELRDAGLPYNEIAEVLNADREGGGTMSALLADLRGARAAAKRIFWGRVVREAAPGGSGR